MPKHFALWPVLFAALLVGCNSEPSNKSSPVDSDGDGFVDSVDAFPNDAIEWFDTDNDGVGNNADTDDDGDGVLDAFDGAPLDPSISDKSLVWDDGVWSEASVWH